MKHRLNLREYAEMSTAERIACHIDRIVGETEEYLSQAAAREHRRRLKQARDAEEHGGEQFPPKHK